MEDEIRQFVKQYPTCQRFKKKKEKKKYSKLPPKNVELIPWNTVCIDLVGPHIVTDPKRQWQNPQCHDIYRTSHRLINKRPLISLLILFPHFLLHMHKIRKIIIASWHFSSFFIIFKRLLYTECKHPVYPSHQFFSTMLFCS